MKFGASTDDLRKPSSWVRWHAAADVFMTNCGLKPARPRVPARLVEPMRRCSQGVGYRTSALVNGDPHGRAVLLIHGTPGSALGWADFVAAPLPGSRVIALDRPGFGSSRIGGAVTSLIAQAASAAEWLNDAARPAVVLGHSLGGAVAAQVAASYPERVGALVLLAASLDPGLERVHPLQRLGAWPGVSKLLPSAIRNSNEELMALQAELVQLAPLLSKIRCPVLMVHGTADALVPPANVDYARTRLRGARAVQITWLQGQGHFLPWLAAASVREALCHALDWCDAAPAVGEEATC